MNYRMISYTLGVLLLFEAGFLLIPAIAALALSENALWAILWSAAACLGAGALLLLTRPRRTTLHARDGFVIVALSWIVLSLFGALPFYISRAIPAFIDALFETVSGFTTTGASILSNVEAMPKSLLLWRSFTHWVGGMGVLVFIMAILPLGGGQNIHIMKAESPGPTVSKLVPRVRTTAFLLYAIYLVMTVAEFILLVAGKMPAFDAICTAFGTAGTGGFGVKNDSLGGYSAYLQIVVGVFMLLFAVNFGSYFALLRKKPREAFTTEVRAFFCIVAAAIAVITVNAYRLFPSVKEALRHVFFAVASIISTTGFSTADFDVWPELSRTILVLLMLIGACAGSTGGGFKVARVVLLVKTFGREVHQAIHPKQVKKITADGKPVEKNVLESLFAFTISTIIIYIVSMLLISVDDLDFSTNFTAVAATLNNIGPGLSLVGPTGNYAVFSTFSKSVLIFDMLAGRLELFPMLFLFSPVTWKR